MVPIGFSSMPPMDTSRPTSTSSVTRTRVKFWLDPVRLADSGGYGAKELRLIEGFVTTNRELLLRAWNDYFAS
jgi:hypothetical protein